MSQRVRNILDRYPLSILQTGLLYEDLATQLPEGQRDSELAAIVTEDLAEAPPRGYIRWQAGPRQALDDAKLSFWEQYLADRDDAAPVGLDGTSSASPFERASALVGPEGRARLEEFARAARVSLTTVVHGAWALVLAGLTGYNDVGFGFTAVSRPQAVTRAQSLVGPCPSTLPLRLVVDRGQNLRGWLRSIMRHTIDLWDDEAVALVGTGVLRRREGARSLVESLLVVETVEAPGAELIARADKLARRLAEHGVLPGDNIAVLMRRSTDLLVTFLAVAKAGAAFVPLEARDPPPRMRSAVAGSGCAILLADATTQDHEITEDITVVRADAVIRTERPASDVAVRGAARRDGIRTQKDRR